MTAVTRFIQHNPMPPGVSEELKSYFNINAQAKTQLSLTEQNEIYRNLPLSLQVEAARHISRDSLLSVEIFEKTSDYFLDSISTLLDMEIFGVGDFVYKADDICRSLYIIASGSVEMGKVNMDTNEFEVSRSCTAMRFDWYMRLTSHLCCLSIHVPVGGGYCGPRHSFGSVGVPF